MAAQQAGKTDTRIVHLEPGMYLIRFDGTPALGESAIVSVAPGEPGAVVDFFESEGVQNTTLAMSADCIVARCVGGSGNLLVTSVSLSSDTLAGARVDKIASSEGKVRTRAGVVRPEPIPAASTVPPVAQAPDANATKPATVPVAPVQVPAAAAPAQPAAAAEQIQLMGHIEWKGDVTAQANAWLGDPQGSSRLEGFTVQWHNRPADVDLAYSVVVEGMGRSPAVLSGGFCGSRQRAAAIHGLILTLVGKNAAAYELVVQAVFENTPLQQLGSGVEGRGLTGREKLVALAVGVVRKL